MNDRDASKCDCGGSGWTPGVPDDERCPYHGGPRYPDVHVKLVGEDGNAFAILARMAKALREAGVEQAEIDEFIDQARARDYGHLLRTCMEWVDAL